MAHWYTVYHNEDYEAEIQVGLYNYWVQQLSFGPTQADRVFNHTPMTEAADERRFVVAQDGIDISGFEAEHSRRIGRALDRIQHRMIDHVSREASEIEEYIDEGLIGLTRFHPQPTFNDCSQFVTCAYSPQVDSVPEELNAMLCEAQQKPRKRAHSTSKDISADSIDEEAYGRYQAELYEELLTTRKRIRALPSTGTLQLKPILHRRERRPLAKDSGKQDT